MAKTKILSAGVTDWETIYAVQQPAYPDFWDVMIDDSTRFVVTNDNVGNIIKLLKKIEKESN